MKSRRQLVNQLLISMVLVCCCQQNWAGVAVKGGRLKNSTTKVSHKAKATTSTATVKSELETTTLPVDMMDSDGRSPFFNNQYVAEVEASVNETSPPLYELLQQQMESVLSNMGENIEAYANDSPQMKEGLDGGVETQKLPGKPLFPYDMSQFDDYDVEEDTNEYDAESEYTPDNCEDTQESLGDNDCGSGYDGTAQLTDSNLPALQNNYGPGSLDNSGPNIFEQSSPNKPYDSSNYPQQNIANQAAPYGNNNYIKPNDSSNYGSQNNTNQAGNYGNNTPQNGYGSTKPIQQQQSHNNNNNNKSGNKSSSKPKPSSQHNSQNSYGQTKPNEHYQQSQPVPVIHYIQSKPLEHYGHANQKPLTNQNSYDKPKLQQQHQKPHYNTGKNPQNSYNKQKPTGNNKLYAKPSAQQIIPGFNNKPSPYGNFNQPTSTSYYTQGNLNFLNPFLSTNFPAYDSTNTETSSPFSINFGHSKIPRNAPKRHLSFRTVSSSTQYVSTPLVDLMFNFSVGMAKPLSNTKLAHNSVNNQVQVFNVLNDIDAKTE